MNEKVKIRKVANFIRGVSYKKNQATRENADGHTAILRANNISRGNILMYDLVFVPDAIVKEEQIINTGDIIITMSSGSKAHVGKVALAKNLLINCAFGAFCGKLVCKEDIIPTYLFFLLQSQRFRQHIEKKCAGTNINNIKQDYVLDYEIALPPKVEQRFVVSRLEELFSELDKGVETLQTIKLQLAVYRQAVLKEALQGDFNYCQLKDISTSINGYAFKSKKYVQDGKYTVIKIGNIKQWDFDFSKDFTKTDEVDESILKKYLLKQGDCLITLTGSRGKRDYGYIAMVDSQVNFLLNQRVAALRFNKNVALPKFYKYYLSSCDFRNQFFSYETGNVGQGNVGVKALREPIVVCPPIEEQRRIVEKIESRLSVCDSIEKAVERGLAQAEALRQSILKKAFEGGFRE